MATTNFVSGTVIEATWLNDVDAHVYDEAGTKHTADKISVTPAGTLASTDVQSALEELANGTYLVPADIGVTVQGYDSTIAKYGDTTANFTGTLQNGGSNVLVDTDIGSTVQAYDADTAKLDVDQSWTGSQRGTITTDNDLSFNMAAANNFSCTPTGNGTLTFTNITSGQSGFILLDNSGAYTISAAATTKMATNALSTLSGAGIYLLSYFSNGTNVYVTNSGALA